MTRNVDRRVRLAIMSCVGIVACVSAVTSGVISFEHERQSEMRQVRVRSELAAAQVARRVEHGAEIVSQLNILLRNSGRNQSRDQISSHLRAIAENAAEIYGVWFVASPTGLDAQNEAYRGVSGSDRDGVFVPYWRRSSAGGVIQDTTGAQPTAAEDRLEPYYTDPVAAGRMVLIEPYRDQMEADADAVLMTTIAMPVIVDGALLGVAGVDIALGDLDALLASASAGQPERLALISPGGEILGDSAIGAQAPELTKVEVDTVLARGVGETFFSTSMWSAPSIVQVTSASYRSLKENWTIIAALPLTAPIMAALKAALLTIFVALVAGAATAVFARRLSSAIAAPIIATERDLARLASGERIEPGREVSDLAEIESMQRALAVVDASLAERAKLEAEAAENGDKIARLYQELEARHREFQSGQRMLAEYMRAMIVKLERGELMEGELDQQTTPVGVAEVDEAIQALKFVAGVIKDRTALQQDFMEKSAENERLLAELTAKNAHAALAHELVAEEMRIAMMRIFDSDLTYRITAHFPDDYRSLRMDYNAVSERLREIVISISDACAHIKRHAEDVASRSAELASKTEQAHSGIAITSAALEEITETVSKNISGAGRVREAVQSARAEAHGGADVLKHTIAAIAEIERSSSQISSTINVIDSIAFQTNLLALNAGVEAARAGDAGRGFSVIAEEVRALSHRATEAARSIKSLISESETKVQEGVRLVGRSGDSLTGIVSRIDEISDLVQSMASLADEQTQSLMMVRMAIEELDALSKQSLDVLSLSRSASDATSAQADGLSAMVARFRVSDAEPEAPASEDIDEPAPRVA